MSNLFSSIVIDPVLRQARRFSRSAADVNGPSRPSLSHESVEASTDGSAASDHSKAMAPSASGLITDQELNGQDLCLPSNTILAGSMVESPTSEVGGLGAQLEEIQRQSAPPSVTSSTSGPRSFTRRRSSPPDSEISLNPSYGIPDRFATTDLAMTPSFSNSAAVAVEGVISPAGARSRRSTGQNQNRNSVHNLQAIANGSGSLPADDGMSRIRQKIAEIREMEISGYEKARRMHEVMTEQYESSKITGPEDSTIRPHSPASLHGHERPYTPTTSTADANGSVQTPLTPTSMLSVEARGGKTYNLSAEDLRPTFIHQENESQPVTQSQTSLEETGVESNSTDESNLKFGCRHYKRNVKLQCSTCHKWYTCRFCHDEVESHALIRKETKHMLCMLCGCAQAAAESCEDCGLRGGWYYCDVCKLWDDDPEKSIYHCNDCGLCRVGRGLGKDFFHCKTCGVCMSIAVATSHRCIERATECDCPICGEYMFTSPETVVFMPCGHSIHHKCYYAHMKESYRCPICSKSIVNMESQFRNMDRVIESQPMPEQFQETKALVYCNDCLAKTSVKYHWLGLKCGICLSYNTAQIQILSGRKPAELPEPDANGPLHLAGPHDVVGHTISSAQELIESSYRFRNPSASGTPLVRSRPESHQGERPPQRQSDSGPSSKAKEQPMMPADQDDDDDDDVDFWGGESPRDRRLHSLQSKTGADDEEQSDLSDDDDIAMDNEDEEEEEDDDDDDLEEDAIDVFGHR